MGLQEEQSHSSTAAIQTTLVSINLLLTVDFFRGSVAKNKSLHPSQ